MKKTISILLIFSFLLYMLYVPAYAAASAANGLLLWYKTILPALLPFAIISNVLITSDGFYLISRLLYPLLHKVLPVSREGVYPLCAGFLFGFPMGSHISSKMLAEGKISYQEASVIFIISNNLSPMFVSSYLLHEALRQPQLTAFTYGILYLPPLFMGKLLLAKADENNIRRQQKATSRFQMNFKIIDAAIMNGFETLLKLGGYIMLFSMLAGMIDYLTKLPVSYTALLIGITESTNGIQTVAGTLLPERIKYLFCIGFTAFGGLSGIAQTSAMINQTGLSIKKYIGVKLILAVCSSLMAWFFYPYAV